MKAYFYFLIKPIRELVVDNDTSIGLEIEIQNHNVKMGLLQYEDGQPKALRFEINNLSKEEIPEHIMDIIHASKEHFLSIVRMNYDHEFEFLDKAIWSFHDTDKGPALNIKFTEEFFPPDLESIKNVFINSIGHRNLIKLLTDGTNTRLPLKFRFLSLYKIIEFKFLKNGKWKIDELKTYLLPYEHNLSSKKLRRPFYNLLHDIRNRCAHFKTNGEGLGISALKRKDEMEINDILEELISATTSIVNAELQGKVTILRKGK